MLKALAKSVIEMTPYRVVRARDANRFSAIPECLEALAGRGYRPRQIIDGGANVGAFARIAARTFPDSIVHLVEPQPHCQAALKALSKDPRFRLHPVALGAKNAVIKLAVDPDKITTGAHIVIGLDSPLGSTTIDVAAVRLDDLLRVGLVKDDRALLKLDLQGWELEALRGAEGVLDRIEVIIAELSFFAQAYEPSIEVLMGYVCDRGFALHDVAAISARPRDNRAHQCDLVFVRRDSSLMLDTAWA